jgi:hypothetical protein
MGYWPNRMKKRRHSWMVSLVRKMTLLNARGSHTKLFLCKLDGVGRLSWRTAPEGKVLAVTKHYYLSLSDHEVHEHGGSQGNTTVRAAGAEAGKGKDTQIKFLLKAVEGGYHNALDLAGNKHGTDVDDATKLAETYVVRPWR